MALYGFRQLWGTTSKGKGLFTKIIVYFDALMVLGFWVLIGDIFWCVACYLRFASTYSGGNQLLISILRNFAGVIFCYLSVKNLFRSKKVRFDFGVFIGLLLNFMFLVVWFMSAQTPAFTDWTYAIRHGYPFNMILTSLMLSHVIGKAIIGYIYFSSWSFTK